MAGVGSPDSSLHSGVMKKLHANIAGLSNGGSSVPMPARYIDGSALCGAAISSAHKKGVHLCMDAACLESGVRLVLVEAENPVPVVGKNGRAHLMAPHLGLVGHVPSHVQAKPVFMHGVPHRYARRYKCTSP